jgi:ATP-dependent DNA ligase
VLALTDTRIHSSFNRSTDALTDGEIAVLDADGRSLFNPLMSSTATPQKEVRGEMFNARR